MADYAKFSSPGLRRLFRSPFVALLSHWTFQSIFYMDRTERIFKVILDILFFIVGVTILRTLFPLKNVWLPAFLFAHTINFLFNGHLWGVLKHYDMVHHEWDEFEQYKDRMMERIRSERSIAYAAICGSCLREQWSASSDLDIRLVRAPGVRSALSASLFAFSERARAFACGFPLDLYVFDQPSSLQKMRSDEKILLGES